MSAVIIIPARYASSRFPGKPLQPLTGLSGITKPLIQHAWEAAKRVPDIDAVYVATDDERIEAVAHDFGANVIMTDEDCRNGTERCAQAVMNHGIDADIIVNFQGDAPLTPPWFVTDLVDAMQSDCAIKMATPVLEMDLKTLKHFKKDRSQGRIGGTTAIFNHVNNALYFSKEVVPYCDESLLIEDKLPSFYHHIGVYAYQASALKEYISWPESELERLEGLEQLRFLANGCAIKCIKVNAQGQKFWELNNPTDVALVEPCLD